MKIFVLGLIYPDSFARNVITTLERMGHAVSFSRAWSMSFRSQGRLRLLRAAAYAYPPLEAAWQRPTIQQIIDDKPDMIIQPGMEQVHPELLAQVKRETTAVLAVWLPDAIANFGRQYVFASPFDAYFTKEPYLARFLQDKLQKRAFVLPEACNPIWHNRVSLTESERLKYGCDVTLAGTMYYARALILEQLMEFDIKMWGNNCPPWLNSPATGLYQRHYVAEGEKAKAFNAAKIVLNTLHYTEIEGVNCRTFEAAGCGAFQITEDKPALANYFKPDEEIVTFRTTPELRDKIRYYLNHSRERQAIADKGYRRAQAEHTYEARLAEMIEICQRL